MKGLKISGRLLARNTVLNLVGQAVPLLVGVVTIPFIVRGLGTERFGLLSLAWVILGYFSIFDLGLGRATTKYVAEALGKGEEGQVPSLVWTTVTVQGVFGLVGAFVLVSITPLLVGHLLNIPPELRGEAQATFYWLAIGVPVVLVSSSFSGVLQAAQRFDLLNTVQIPSSVLTFLMPLVGLLFGLHLPGIVASILISRVVALAALVALDFRVLGKLRKFSVHLALFPRLFAYGGWVTVSNIVGPVLVYLDRFLIGSLLSMSAVAYYTAPYDVIIRLQVLSVSLAITLFPTFSALEAMGDRERLGRLYARSVKFIFLTLGPAIILLVLYADEALRFWLGDVFARESAPVLRLLGLGVFVNSLAHVPYTLLQGAGRPDIPAKFHLMELPFYAALAWVLIATWGITGAALAWTLRVVVDAGLLFVASWKVFGLRQRVLAENGLSGSLISVAALGVGLLPLTLQSWGPVVQAMVAGVLVAGFAGGVWRYVLESVEKDAVLSMLKQLYPMSRGE